MIAPTFRVPFLPVFFCRAAAAAIAFAAAAASAFSAFAANVVTLLCRGTMCAEMK
jgi:hypothetical protein